MLDENVITTNGEKTSTETSFSTVKFVADVEIKSPDDDMDCGVTGSVLMPHNRLIISDYDNEKLKVIDTEVNQLTGELTLTSGPTDITKIGDNQIAVALPDERKIVLVGTEAELVVQKELAMSGKCWGVCHSEGRLIVSLQEPDKVEIVDTSGCVLKTFENNDESENIFCDPECASVSPDDRFIFVSNYGDDSIVKLDWDGQVVVQYFSQELKYPGNVVFDGSGNLYVCGYTSNTLHQICESSETFHQLLSESDGLDRPASLCFDKSTNRLYIGMKADNMKIFQLSSG